MMLDVHKKIRVETEAELGGKALRISIRFQEGSTPSDVKATAVITLHGCGNVMAAFKRGLADLEAQIAGQFDAGEIVDISKHFIQGAEKLGYKAKEAC